MTISGPGAGEIMNARLLDLSDHENIASHVWSSKNELTGNAQPMCFTHDRAMPSDVKIVIRKPNALIYEGSPMVEAREKTRNMMLLSTNMRTSPVKLLT
jgi:hypothetical protein